MTETCHQAKVKQALRKRGSKYGRIFLRIFLWFFSRLKGHFSNMPLQIFPLCLKRRGILDRPFSLMIRHRHVVDGLIWQRHAPKEVLVNGLTLRRLLTSYVKEEKKN